MTADLTFEQLATAIQRGEVEAIADALLAMDEPARRALGKSLPAFAAARMPRIDLAPPESWQLMRRRNDAMRVAGAGCLTGAAKVVSWLRNFGNGDDSTLASTLIRVLRAPGRPSLAVVARGMATRLRSNQIHQQWRLISRLLDAAGEPVPPTEATLRGWLRETGCSSAALRDDPRTPYLLPHVFTIPGLGTEVSAGGLANLAEQRDVVFSGCLFRLAEGDRANAVRSFVELHRMLAPGLDECAEHRQSYLVMVNSPHSTVVTVAQESLRAVDDAGLLDTEAVADAALSVLARREKKVVRAQLAWLDQALARKADPVLFEALLTGLANESTDLAERTLRLAGKHLPAFGPTGRERLASAAETLTGDLHRQVTELLPEIAPAPPLTDGRVPAAAAVAAAAALEPVRSIPELVPVVVELLRLNQEPLLTEQVLDALVRFANTDREALAAALKPKVPDWSGALTNLLRAVIQRSWTVWQPSYWEINAGPLFWMLAERLRELGGQMAGTLPPALLATPATLDGHVDPERVLSLLAAGERDGWQPGPYDLSQAMLRLPRTVDPAVLAGAERLTGPAGRLFAAWLRGGGLPDPVVVTLTTIWHRCPDPDRCTCEQPPITRRTSAFDAIPLPVPTWHAGPGSVDPLADADGPDPQAGTNGRLGLPAASAARPAGHAPEFTLAVPPGLFEMPADPDRTRGNRSNHAVISWPMVLPGHPEIVAAQALPQITMAADGNFPPQLDILPALAASTGPFGPALALCLARGLSADHRSGRTSATDAFVELAARGKLDGALIGREMAHLQRGGWLNVKRVAGCLTDALRAEVTTEVWTTVRELLPAALAAPDAGTPALLTLAEAAASAVHATEDLPEVAEVAGRSGRTRLITEAARLARTLTANRTPGGA
ncbi:hypothetical protein [Actinoplanes regularis]|uniref:Secreted protein n=1 Tax=Actinoplanes regularis TaxID=52697 RepID=A0A238Y734_9ACTN|nr:hypothetical protein [Actinoplanes regularis]GIE86191.1 hypothetical protein Are01nite_26710 [Actinoplanes regularis]SNR66139.1 hypothetical protein SAMN06264365_104261 [Actinoplanes regularis]